MGHSTPPAILADRQTNANAANGAIPDFGDAVRLLIAPKNRIPRWDGGPSSQFTEDADPFHSLHVARCPFCSLEKRRLTPGTPRMFRSVDVSRLQRHDGGMSDVVRIGVVTVSDRASRGEYEDRGGPAILAYFSEVLATPHEIDARVIPDEKPLIEEAIRSLAAAACCLVVTTGGTGPAKRDVTPEATEAVCDKMMPGFGELMRAVSLTKVPTAILSRQTAGIIGQSLVVNLPGQPKAIGECLDAVMPAVPYCITLLEGPYLETNPERIVAFRPKKK